MRHSQELYQEYLENRNGFSPKLYAENYKRRVTLQSLVDLPDDLVITLESSIQVLQNIGIITAIKSV